MKKTSISKIIVKIIFVSFLIAATRPLDLFAEAIDYKDEEPRPTIGLVLGGGGARGAAHVGVLKIIEENRVPVDYIVGTSMGAIVGGLYASGMSPEEIEEVFRSIDWKDFFTDRPPRKNLSFRHKQDRKQFIDFEMGFKGGKLVLPRGLIAGQKLSFLFKSLTLHVTDVENFDGLPIPFRAIATDIEAGEMVILDSGNLAEAMRASMSVPGLFSPVEIDGRVLVDGGIVKNVPVDIAKQIGADIIIAVDVGVPLAKRDELESLIDVTMQVTGIMTLQNVKEQISKLEEKDILISPDLGDFSTADYPKTLQIVQIGEDTARSFAKDLERYSVSADEYQVFLSRHRRGNVEPIKIDFVKVEPPARVAPRKVKAKVKTKPGTILDVETLQNDLMRVYEIGDFEQVDFRIAKEEDKKGLLIDTKEKSWGPDYLRFGLNITDDFQGDSYYNFITKYTKTQLNNLGAEWKNEFQIGRTSKFFSEFYQPLDYSDSFFVAPKFKYERSVSDVFSGSSRVAEYRVSSVEGGVDVGINLGTFAEGRFGILIGDTDAEAIVGGEDLPEFSIDQAALTGSFVFDQIDDSNFPRYGIVAHTDLFMAREGLGAEQSYNKLEFGLIKATTYNKHTLLTSFEGGTNLGKEIPFYDEFTLGGFLSLSGYRKGELRGQYLGLTRLIYYYKIAEIFAGWVDDIYIGGSIESGNIWERSSDIDFDDSLFAGSAFVGVDTIFGPLYLGYGLAEGSDEGKFYLFLGQTF